MSDISRHNLPKQVAIIDIYDRNDDQFGKLSIVHPSHPMRKAQTIRVNSLRDMVYPLFISTPHAELTDDATAINYAVIDGEDSKPEIKILLGNNYGIVYRIASTTTVAEDSKSVDGVQEAIKGLLLRRLDAIEATIWLYTFMSYAIWPPLLNYPSSYREIFALSRALLSRLMPYDAFDVMLPPKSYGAALLEGAIGNNSAEYTEPLWASGKLTLVPIASNGFSYLSSNPVCVYPSNLPSLCKRYIYELFRDDRVIDNGNDRNLYRITAERYVVISLPTDYYSFTMEYFVAPIVVMWDDNAITNINTTFGGDTLNNLNVISTIT